MGLDEASAAQLRSKRGELARDLRNIRAGHGVTMKNNINQYLKGSMSEKELVKRGNDVQKSLDSFVKNINKTAEKYRKTELFNTKKRMNFQSEVSKTNSKLLGEIGTNIKKNPNKFSQVAKLAKRWIH